MESALQIRFRQTASKHCFQFQLAPLHHGHPLRLDEGPCEVADADEQEELQTIMSNSNLSANYLTLARDLDVMESKLPEDIYKSHLIEGRAPAGAAVDSARANLAATFVNAFVNAGFGHDKVGLCRLTASKPVLKAHTVSALDTII
jgi:26S proteasome regulatory subunit N1